MAFAGGAGDFDAQLRAAVAASLASEESNARRVHFDRGAAFCVPRALAPARIAHAALENNTGSAMDSAATLEQVNTLNQFHDRFAAAADQYEAPRSACGYLAAAAALVCSDMVQRFPGGVVRTQAQLDALDLHLRDADALLPGVRHAMRFVQHSRAAYMRRHAAEFASAAECREYQRAWVANYELSDYLRHVASAAENSDAAAGGQELRASTAAVAAACTITNDSEQSRLSCCLCGMSPIVGRSFRSRVAEDFVVCEADLAQLGPAERSWFAEAFSNDDVLALNNGM
jgi:hypothetical protein